MRGAFLVLWVCSSACVDFGRPGDASVEDVPDAALDCTEGSADPAGATFTIDIGTFIVDPASITIHPGDVVVWTNSHSARHRMVSGEPDDPILPEDGGFNTGSLSTGERYAHRFCEARTLVYYCSAHPGTMKDYVLVIE